MSEIPPPTVPPTTPPPPGGGSYVPPPPPPPSGPGPGSAPAGDRQLMLVLSYCWWACLIPLFTKKDDSEVQWHAKNGLVMTAAITVVGILYWVVSWFSNMAGCALSWIVCILWLGYVVLCILGIVKALQGQRFRVPVLTDTAEKINI